MNGPSTSQRNAQSAAVRFDRKFIEEHGLLERYLNGKLPFKGARDLEEWCREHPEYLQELNLAERTHASLRLLEASGRPQDLGEPRPPWWRTPYFSVGAGVVAFCSLVGFWALFGKYEFLNDRLADARAQLSQGSMVPATAERERRISPDRAPGIDRALFARRPVPRRGRQARSGSCARDKRFGEGFERRPEGLLQHLRAGGRQIRRQHRSAAVSRRPDRRRVADDERPLSAAARRLVLA